MAFTFFFRDMSILDLIGQHVVPAVSGFTRVRVWDAGCAMGPEPYSLAIVIAERMGHFMFRNVRIDATDIDEQDQFGKTIIAGIYPEEPLKRIPQDLFARYFEPADQPGQFRVVQMVRDRIHFQKHDLLSMTPDRFVVPSHHVQERSSAFSAAGTRGGDPHVPCITCAGRLLRHRTDPETPGRGRRIVRTGLA